MSIKLTDIAVEKIKEILANAKLEAETTYVRVGIAGQNCSGTAYSFALDEEFDETFDSVISEDGGLKVICEKEQEKGFAGIFIDYAETDRGKGFIFNDPMRVLKGEGGCSNSGCGSGGCGTKGA